jgi:HEPN domain-containing protein
VDDEVIGFHCQQAAEKILKALLSDLGVRFRKTHNIRSLMKLITDSGCPLPAEFSGLEDFTPFAVAYRYEVYEPDLSLDRDQARLKIRTLRRWVEAKLQDRRPGE